MKTRNCRARGMARTGVLLALAPMVTACIAGPPPRPFVATNPYAMTDSHIQALEQALVYQDAAWKPSATQPIAPVAPDNSALAELRTQFQQSEAKRRQQAEEIALLRSRPEKPAEPTSAPITDRPAPPSSPPEKNKRTAEESPPADGSSLDADAHRCGFWELCNLWK